MTHVELPDVVGNRNHFVAIEDYADMLIRSPRSGFSESDRPEIMSILRHMVSSIEWALKTGSERGIEQAAALIVDGKFYEAKKASRKRSGKIEAEKSQIEEANKQRRRDNPTSAEISESMRHIQDNIKYHQKSLDTCHNQIRYLQSRPSFLMSSGSDKANA